MAYQVICFGEVLWDFLPQGKEPGGAPMNVTYHLNKSGVPASLISKVGKDDLGDEILKVMVKVSKIKDNLKNTSESKRKISKVSQ